MEKEIVVGVIGENASGNLGRSALSTRSIDEATKNALPEEKSSAIDLNQVLQKIDNPVTRNNIFTICSLDKIAENERKRHGDKNDSVVKSTDGYMNF